MIVREEGGIKPTLRTLRLGSLKIEGRLELDEVLEWLNTIERVFYYKEIPKEMKIKLITLKI